MRLSSTLAVAATSTGGWQVELIPTTGSTNTERPTSQVRTSIKRVCAVIIIVNLIALLPVFWYVQLGRLCSHVIPLLLSSASVCLLASLNIGPTTAHDVQLTQNHSTFYPAFACCSNLSAACPRKGPVSLCSRTPSSSSCRYAHSWAAKSRAIIPDSTLRGPASASLGLSEHDAARQRRSAWSVSSPPGEGLLFRERDFQRGVIWRDRARQSIGRPANRNHGERSASKFGSLLRYHLAAIIFYTHYDSMHTLLLFCWLLGKDAPFLRKPSTVPKQASPGLCHCCSMPLFFLPFAPPSLLPQPTRSSTGHNREKKAPITRNYPTNLIHPSIPSPLSYF